MSYEATEMRKQFTAYADAITAFATAQLIGFTFLMAHGDCFTKNVLGGLWYAICIGVVVNVAYLILVFLCHREVDKIPMESVGLASAVRGLRASRYVIIATDLVVSALLPLAINYAWHQGQFFIDCKG